MVTLSQELLDYWTQNVPNTASSCIFLYNLYIQVLNSDCGSWCRLREVCRCNWKQENRISFSTAASVSSFVVIIHHAPLLTCCRAWQLLTRFIGAHLYETQCCPHVITDITARQLGNTECMWRHLDACVILFFFFLPFCFGFNSRLLPAVFNTAS